MSARSPPVRGKWISKVVPIPTVEVRSTYPPLLFTMPYTVDRRSPAPREAGIVVKNGSKIRDQTDSCIPAPVSETVSLTFP